MLLPKHAVSLLLDLEPLLIPVTLQQVIAGLFDPDHFDKEVWVFFAEIAPDFSVAGTAIVGRQGGKQITFEAPIPEDMRRTIEALEQYRAL